MTAPWLFHIEQSLVNIVGIRQMLGAAPEVEHVDKQLASAQKALAHALRGAGDRQTAMFEAYTWSLGAALALRQTRSGSESSESIFAASKSLLDALDAIEKSEFQDELHTTPRSAVNTRRDALLQLAQKTDLRGLDVQKFVLRALGEPSVTSQNASFARENLADPSLPATSPPCLDPPLAPTPTFVPRPSLGAVPNKQAAISVRDKVLDRLLAKESLQGLTLVGADLHEIDLHGAVLTGLDLRRANLQRTNLGGVIAAEVQLEGADLTGANLSRAELTRANLSRVAIAGARFDGATLTGINFQRATGEGTSFRGAKLQGADLRQARLQNADFEDASLRDAIAVKADLSGARCIGADLGNANMREARLRDANLARTNLEGADFRDADLARANVFGASRKTAKITTAQQQSLVEIAPEHHAKRGE